MMPAANTTTAATIAISPQGVCFWLTIDLPGFFLAGGRLAGADRGVALRDAGVVGGLRWAMGLPLAWIDGNRAQCKLSACEPSRGRRPVSESGPHGPLGSFEGTRRNSPPPYRRPARRPLAPASA